MQGHRATRWLRPQRVRVGTLSLSPLCLLSPLSQRQQLCPGGCVVLLGQCRAQQGQWGPSAAGHPGPGRVGVGRSGDLESCKLETSVSEPRGAGLLDRTQLPLNGSGGSSGIDVSCVVASPTSWCLGGRPFRSLSWIMTMLPNGRPRAFFTFLQPAHCAVARIIM